MCVIICGLTASLPTRAELEQACKYNSDGFGYSVLTTSGSLITAKGMAYGQILDAFEATILENADSVEAWVFHARITTHGATNSANCHPFQLGGDVSTVIAHNGILPARLPKGYAGSDSAYFAETLLPMWGGVEALSLPETWGMLEKWIGNSKIAILSANPAAPLPLIILNEDLGVWEGDFWYSNTYHRIDPAALSRAYGWSDYDWDRYAIASRLDPIEAEPCPYCSALVDWDDEVCSFCYSCFGCGFMEETCRCVTVVTADLGDF